MKSDMINTRFRSILIIVIAALLVSILFNIRTFISLFEMLQKAEAVDPERVKKIECYNKE
ncbi:MAG: hypothetical protein J7K53_02060 [Bacteroidales bacterium]|nr:hypothetical protein [Bacteroidales bacterium]